MLKKAALFLIFLSLLKVAAYSLAVSPPRINYILDATSDPKNGTIQIWNTSSFPLEVKVSLKEMKLGALEKNIKNSCADWIFFTPSKLKIAPQSSRKIRYSIALPEKVSEGYYEAIFFVSEKPSLKDKGISVVPRLGIPVRLRIRD